MVRVDTLNALLRLMEGYDGFSELNEDGKIDDREHAHQMNN